MKWINNSQMPKWLKIILYTLLTITLVYWLILFIYKFLELLRIVIHWCSDKRNWWTFVGCILILGVGSLLLAQFVFGLDPFGKLLNWVLEKFKI